MENKIKSPRNQTLTITEDEKEALLSKTISLSKASTIQEIENQVINQDFFECIKFLPDNFIDLLIIDPPYNLNKSFGENKFSKIPAINYEDYIDSFIKLLVRCLKQDASIYVCSDWQSSICIQNVLDKYFMIRNRITWEREKGRGANKNWKNCSEDIWFYTVSQNYKFNVDAVKLKRKVLAPYRDKSGTPKDWEETDQGNYRLTYPSNLWTDISIPFWSMPENTDHPTQKPEKLLAKLILASSNEGDFVFDPFLGSGSTCVAAKKLGRKFAGIEVNEEYCEMAIKRLEIAEKEGLIQGYRDGCFWERNSMSKI